MTVSAIAFTGCGNKNTTPKAAPEVQSESLSILNKSVDEAITKANAAKATDNAETNQKQFIELNHLLNSVDDKLDAHDDLLESQYRQGILSYDDYRSQEHSLDQLEDKLDAAEDKLELEFKIDHRAEP